MKDRPVLPPPPSPRPHPDAELRELVTVEFPKSEILTLMKCVSRSLIREIRKYDPSYVPPPGKVDAGMLAIQRMRFVQAQLLGSLGDGWDMDDIGTPFRKVQH